MAGQGREYVVVDLETTGLDPLRDEIIEIAAVRVRRGLIVERFSTLVACDQQLSPEIVALTGISQEMLAGQPQLEAVLPEFADFVAEAELIAHNAEFDAAFLHQHWPDQRPWLDSLTLAQIVYPTAPSFSLANLTARLGIDNDQAHRALSDALATAELFIRAEKELERLPVQAKADLLQLAEGDVNPLGELIRRKCSQVGAAAREPAAPRQPAPVARVVDEEYQLDLAELGRYLGEDSLYRQRLADFEDRPQQLKMSLAVGRALNQRGALLVEAGTGTGKSLAYLLPAALFSLGSGAQVAISTHTRNLQEQLLHKDIPMLSRLLDRELRAAVVKGRGNYLCRRLYAYLLSDPPANMRYFLMRVAVWRANGGIDGGELNLSSYDKWKWQRLSAAKENCVPFCPHARRNSCLVQRVRAEAGRADIIILNHSLLVANAAVENGFLPPLPHLIIDEAQHLEGAAEDQLTAAVDIFEVLNLLSRLTRREKGKQVGALPALRKYAAKLSPEAMSQLAERVLDDLERDVGQVIEAAERLFDLVNACLRAEAAANAYYPARVRILERHRYSGDWNLAEQAGEECAAALNSLARNCFRLLDVVSGQEDEAEEERAKPPGSEELFGVGTLAREMAATVQTCVAGADDNYVSWAEFPDQSKRPSLRAAPIEIDRLLYENLYQPTQTLVMTSATLAAGRDFHYFRRRLGLDLLDQPPDELVLASPFFYRDQALFTIVNDLPDWSKCGEIVAAEAVGQALIPLLTASQGRAIVLFTSHHQLKAVFERIRTPLRAAGITLLAHGVSGEPSGLLERLKKEENCCILGANSFWEGVDVIGSALSLIVVVRLPFWPPNSPLAASRMERIEAEGRSSFYDYSLPQALVRFKQGFGRLIRSSQDSGVFCVLDRRIVEKGYGSRFIRALPDMRRVTGSSQEVAARIAAWLG